MSPRGVRVRGAGIGVVQCLDAVRAALAGVDVVEVAVSVGVHRSTVHGWVGPVDQVSAWRALPMPQDLSNNAISTVVA